MDGPEQKRCQLGDAHQRAHLEDQQKNPSSSRGWPFPAAPLQPRLAMPRPRSTAAITKQLGVWGFSRRGWDAEHTPPTDTPLAVHPPTRPPPSRIAATLANRRRPWTGRGKKGTEFEWIRGFVRIGRWVRLAGRACGERGRVGWVRYWAGWLGCFGWV
jgi:hypothetical protein